MFKKNNKQQGISLFIAVTVTSVLLVISYAVLNIATKSIQFASLGKDSQLAFYAADAGVECAIYWDSKFDSFATSTSGSPISCGSSTIQAGQAIPDNAAQPATTTSTRVGGGGSANPTSTFGFTMTNGANSVSYCAIVTVRKYYTGAPSQLNTYIKSRGYNTCDTANTRRVERGVEVTY